MVPPQQRFGAAHFAGDQAHLRLEGELEIAALHRFGQCPFGLNLELVEEITPAVSIVSSVHDGGKYGFPHAVSQEALREALDPISSKPPGSPHKSDAELRILYTSSCEQTDGKADRAKPLGTVALVVGAGGRREIWRFCDGAADTIDLTRGRRVRAAAAAVPAPAGAAGG